MTEAPACRIVPPPFLADPGLAALLDVLPEARVVGGAVRDTLAGRPAIDIDLASALQPQVVTQRLAAAGIKVVPTGLAHGTVTAVLAGCPVEITTLRRDVETDGRHAVVAFTHDWREDAARRDFTINAMSMTRDGAVFDYFGGLDDLHAGRLRFVGDPAARVAEDYLRVLRFFRFFARYGAIEPDTVTQDALRNAVPHLGSLSVERVWHELTRILAAPDPLDSVALMHRLGVLEAVVLEGCVPEGGRPEGGRPEGCEPTGIVPTGIVPTGIVPEGGAPKECVPQGVDLAALQRLIRSGAPVDPLLRMAALLTGDTMAFALRLKLSLAERDRLAALHNAPLAQPGDDDRTLRRLLADTPAAILIDRTWLGGGDDPAWHSLRRRLQALDVPIFPLEGRDLLAMGLIPGPAVGKMLREIRAWWMDAGCTADAVSCREEARRRLRHTDSPPDTNRQTG